MKVLVCGSRDFNNYNLLKETLDAYSITGIIHGGARGADRYAGRYGNEMGIPVSEFHALWDIYGRSAGPIRNAQMLREGNPDMVIAFPIGASRGTKNMIEQAQTAGIPVTIVEVEVEN